MIYITHVTVDGERWDQIAAQYYGDVHDYGRLIAANPDVPITVRLPAGLVLIIPVIELDDTVIDNSEDLPPWKR